jgi:hypothetical protein
MNQPNVGAPASTWRPSPWWKSIRQSLWLVALVTAGCGGCALCGADVKTNTPRKAGQAIVEVDNLTSLVSGNAVKTVSISYSGTRKVGIGNDGQGSFEASLSYEVRASGVTPAPTLKRVNLATGDWEVSINDGSFSASCKGKIKENAATRFTFRYGQGGCKVK